MDSIFISELKIETRIGIYDWEKKVPQTIQLDIEVGLPGAHAAKSGKIDDTIDYSKIVARIEKLLQKPSPKSSSANSRRPGCASPSPNSARCATSKNSALPSSAAHAAESAAVLPARMMLGVKLFQAFACNVCVNLRG